MGTGWVMTPPKVLAAAILAAAALAVPSAAQADGPSDARARPQAVAVGVFSANLNGVSVFRQTDTTVKVNGFYFGLPANRSFFTVAYANNVCDPAQAFPVGPFYTNARGFGRLSTSVPAPAGIVAGTDSISVRRGDDATDIDRDTLVGPTDVVAVPGQPSIGLVECDSGPSPSSR